MRYLTTLFIAVLLVFTSLLNASSKKIALVLGSGGSKGMAHVGVIEQLEELDIIPDIIIGCSSGAIIGAIYADSGDVQKVKNVCINLTSDDLLDLSFFQKKALSSNEKLQKFLEKNLSAKNFDELKKKLYIVTTDLQKGELKYFHEGPLLDVLLASAALPGVFPPVMLDGKMYIDGGCLAPLPIHFAKELGDVVVIASDVNSSLDAVDTDSFVGVLRKAFEIMYGHMANDNKASADVVIEMNFQEVISPTEDGQNQKFYQLGKDKTLELKEKIMKAVS